MACPLICAENVIEASSKLSENINTGCNMLEPFPWSIRTMSSIEYVPCIFILLIPDIASQILKHLYPIIQMLLHKINLYPTIWLSCWINKPIVQYVKRWVHRKNLQQRKNKVRSKLHPVKWGLPHLSTVLHSLYQLPLLPLTLMQCLSTMQPLNTFLTILIPSCNMPMPCLHTHHHPSTAIFRHQCNRRGHLPIQLLWILVLRTLTHRCWVWVHRMGVAVVTFSDEIQFYVKNSYFTNLCQSITNVEKHMVKLCWK